MIKLKFKVCLSIVLFGFSHSIVAQEYKDVVRRMYQSMEDSYSVGTNQYLFMQYDIITTTVRYGQLEEHTMSCKNYGGDSRKYFLSSDVEMYQDEETSIMVDHSEQMIIITDVDFSSEQNKLNKLHGLNQDIIDEFCSGSVEHSRTNDHDLLIVRVELCKQYQDSRQLRQLKYTINPLTYQLVSLTIEFQPGGFASSIEYRYNQYRTESYPFDILSSKPLGLIYTGRDLKKNYTGYNVVDQRR